MMYLAVLMLVLVGVVMVVVMKSTSRFTIKLSLRRIMMVFTI